MAAVHELDGFFFHFKHLLFSGYEASLKINSKDGKASVNLTADLDAMNNCKVIKKKQRSPSYYNRLERRKKERKDRAVKASEASNSQLFVNDEMEAVISNEITAAETLENSSEEIATVEAVEENGAEQAEEEVAAEASSSAENENVAEMQQKKLMKWICDVHGCVVLHRQETKCSCCGDGCVGEAYDCSDNEYQDLLDPP